MSRADDVRKLLAAFRNMKADGTYWNVVVDAIVDAIEARIRELTHGAPVQPEAMAHKTSEAAGIVSICSTCHGRRYVADDDDHTWWPCPICGIHKTSEAAVTAPGQQRPEKLSRPEDSGEAALSQPSPVGAKAPERVWCRFYANGAIATHAEHREQADCYVLYKLSRKET